MNRVAIWPFATPMDSSGTMADPFQSVYARGLCRALAEGLLRTNVCEVAVCLPIARVGGETCWAVLGKAWTFEEAVEIMLPEGTDFMAWGTMVLTEHFEIHLLLRSHSQRRSLLDRTFRFPRVEIPACLSDVVWVLANAIVGRPLSEEEKERSENWGTTNSEAYLAYLDTWDTLANYRFGVSVPNPPKRLESARSALILPSQTPTSCPRRRVPWKTASPIPRLIQWPDIWRSVTK